jgi:hypothetical protein
MGAVMLAITSDNSAGAWMTLVIPVGFLILVVIWSLRFRDRVR